MKFWNNMNSLHSILSVHHFNNSCRLLQAEQLNFRGFFLFLFFIVAPKILVFQVERTTLQWQAVFDLLWQQNQTFANFSHSCNSMHLKDVLKINGNPGFGSEPEIKWRQWKWVLRFPRTRIHRLHFMHNSDEFNTIELHLQHVWQYPHNYRSLLKHH